MAFSCLWTLLRWAFFLAILAWIIQYWITTKSYLFSEDEVAAIVKKHVGPSYRDAYREIHQEFRRRYPGHILPAQDLQWIFVNAGGWMGSMCLLHASVTEYVLFFGAALDTTGHSGRYWANISDTILTGSFKQWPEGTTEALTYKPGDTIHHAWGETTAVYFAGGTWMVEYGRGFIPSTLGFALSDTIFSTQDFLTMYYIFRIYAKAMWLEMQGVVGPARDFINEQFF